MKLQRKLIIAAIAASVALSPVPSVAGGVPTIDGANLMQNLMQLIQQMEQLKQMVTEWEALTASYGRGQTNLWKTNMASQFVPDDWQKMMKQIDNSTEYGKRQKYYNDLLKLVGEAEEVEIFGEGGATSYRMNANALRSALSTSDVMYEQVQKYMENIRDLANQVDSAANPKDAQDLASRIQVEQAMIATNTAKIQANALNLQAQMNEGLVKAKQDNAKFFTGYSDSGNKNASKDKGSLEYSGSGAMRYY
jgi:type IV secretion system protein VirB5